MRKNAEKCGKMRKKCGKNAEKCGLKFGTLRKIADLSWQWSGNGEKNHKSQTKKNPAEKIKSPIMAHFHENWTKWHFEGTFWPLFTIYMPGSPRKRPQMPQNYSIYLGGHPGILGEKKCGKNAEKCGKCGKMRKMRKNADRNFPPPPWKEVLIMLSTLKAHFFQQKSVLKSPKILGCPKWIIQNLLFWWTFPENCTKKCTQSTQIYAKLKKKSKICTKYVHISKKRSTYSSPPPPYPGQFHAADS
jgi:hypothetical protein